MSNNRYVLVDEEFQKQVLKELEKLRQLVESQNGNLKRELDDLMDSADVIRYLKISRKTLNNYIKKGLPYEKIVGKLYFYRVKINQFINGQIQ